MTIDIGAHLRRLVLAGLPLVAAGCEVVRQPPDPVPLALSAACQPRLVLNNSSTPGSTQVVAVGFEPDDGRVADLYEACVREGDYCARLCQEVVALIKPAQLSLPTGHQILNQVLSTPPHRCELACDRGGRPVATVTIHTGPPPAIGRRPQGFGEVASSSPGTSLADFFAACAALEGASIAAFATLAAELEHHGAPPALSARARAAAREEAQHFKITARLARRFGAGPVRCPRVRTGAPRDLHAVAMENVTEGCVSETFSAAVALWQAATAGDPAVRAALTGIAADELSHGQLAWDVHAWASARLGPTATDELAHARREAAARLHAGCQGPVDPELVARAGLPDAATATWLASQASRALELTAERTLAAGPRRLGAVRSDTDDTARRERHRPRAAWLRPRRIASAARLEALATR